MRLPENIIIRRFLPVLICLFFISASYADHLKGGWIKYNYVSASGGKITYSVSIYQYSDCSEPEKVDPAVFLGVYDAGTLAKYTTQTIRT